MSLNNDKIKMKNFMRDWMYDVSKYDMPDLAHFRPKWEEAQKLNILDYNEYKNYKRKDAKNIFKDKINKISNSISSSSIPIVTEGKLSNHNANNNKKEMSSNVKLFIEENIDLIEDENWDELFELAQNNPKYPLHLNDGEIDELIYILVNTLGANFEIIE